MADKSFSVSVLDLSIELCEELLTKVDYSIYKDDVKLATADYVLRPNYPNFSSMLKLYAKPESEIRR